jgi:hypothetical protein
LYIAAVFVAHILLAHRTSTPSLHSFLFERLSPFERRDLTRDREYDVFGAYIEVIETVLQAVGISESFINANVARFLRVLLEVYSRSRGMLGTHTGSTVGGVNVALTAAERREADATLQARIDACYLHLVHRIEESADEVALAFHLYLLPVIDEWRTPTASASETAEEQSDEPPSSTRCTPPSKRHERTLELGMVIEALTEVGPSLIVLSRVQQSRTVMHTYSTRMTPHPS